MANQSEIYHHQHHHHHVQSPVHGVGGFGQALPPQTHHGLSGNNNNNNNQNQAPYPQQGASGYNSGQNQSPTQGQNPYFNGAEYNQSMGGNMNQPGMGNGGNQAMNLNANPNPNTQNPSHHHHQSTGPGGPNRPLGGQYPLDNQGTHRLSHGSNNSTVQDKPLPSTTNSTRHDHHHGHQRDGYVEPQTGLASDQGIRSPPSASNGRTDLSHNGRHASNNESGIGAGRPINLNNPSDHSSSHSSSKSGQHHLGRTTDGTNSNGNYGSNGNSLGSSANNNSSYGTAGRRSSPGSHEKVSFGDKLAGFTEKFSGKLSKNPDKIADGEARMAGTYDTTY